MKFSRRQIGEIVLCLLDRKKTTFRLALQLSLLRGYGQNLPGPAADNVLRVLQISPKSVQF